MKRAKKWRPALRILVILTILVPYFSSLAVLLSQDAEAITNEPQVLFNEENYGKVEASYVEKEATIEWTIDYQKYQDTSTNDDVQRLMKLRLEQVANGVGTVKNMNDSDLTEEDDWYVEKEFSAESKGTLIIEMPKDVLELTIEVQMDEQRTTTTIQEVETAVLAAEVETAETTEAAEPAVQTEEVTETVETSDILSSTDAGPHTVTAEVAAEEPQPEVQPEVQPEAVEEVEASQPNEEVAETNEAEDSAGETENEETLTSEQEENPAPSRNSFAGNTFSANAFAEPVVDPFKYYEEDEHVDGLFPKHWTDEYLDNPVSTSENVRNYNYGDEIDEDDEDRHDGVEIFNVSSDPLSFANGYHEYGSAADGRINTKKTVRPTEDKNIFEVQLDTIGDVIQTADMVDVVLVLDKSGSMNTEVDKETGDTRWDQLKEAVGAFADSLLGANSPVDVQIGLAGFGSTGGIFIDHPYGEIASFSALTSDSLPTTMRGFTTSADAVKGHGILSSTPEYVSRTPTFLGVDAGLKLLTTEDNDTGTIGYGARPGAVKVLITITDGVPTYYPETRYYSTGTTTIPLDTSLGYLTKSRVNNNRTLRMRPGDSYYGGTGAVIANYSTANVNFINARYAQFTGINRYGVGFHDEDGAANDVVSALGKEGAYSASDVDELITSLKNAFTHSIATISGGILTDPMSEYVTMVPNSLTTSALYLTNGQVAPAPSTATFANSITTAYDSDTQTIVANNVCLGSDENGRQGYRITYKVALNSDFHDGTFYPTNGTTYLANNSNRENHYYAVPSVKVLPTKFDFELTKKVTGTEAILEGAGFKLFTQRTGGSAVSDEVFSDENGIVSFTDVEPGTYWLRETSTPEGFRTMAPIEITIDSEGDVTTADEEVIEDIFNDLKEIKLILNKKASDRETSLEGAEFVLKDKLGTVIEYTFRESDIGEHILTGVAPGEYKLFETVAPDGYKILGEIGTLIISDTGEITFVQKDSTVEVDVDKTGDYIEVILPDVVNELKPFDLSILKKSSVNGALLKDAEFSLYDEESSLEDPLATATTDEDGIGLFIKEGTDDETFPLASNSIYYIKETQAPDGFILLDGIFTVKVAEDGSVTVSYGTTNLAKDAVTVDLVADEDNNTIQFTAENRPKGQLPSTGGPGRKSSMIVAAVLIVFATGTAVYYVYRNRKGAK